MSMTALLFVLGIGLVSGGEPVVNCPAPRSPEHGQNFLYQEGQVVKYVCEPGYVLRGKEIVRCMDGEWEEPTPTCAAIGDIDDVEETLPLTATDDASPPLPPPRPLFNWGDDATEDASDVTNSTDDVPMGDQARVRTVIYPGRLLVRNALLRRAALRNRVIEMEEEDRKAQTGGSTTTIHLQAPPSLLYVRRTVDSGKSLDKTQNQQYRRAAVRTTVEQNSDQEQVQSDKGDDSLRQYYWMAQHYYNQPEYYRQASSMVDYASVHPYTLSESQIAWINSLHPELRDQYLRDMYVVRSDHAAEGARAQAFLSRYGDAYNYYHPYYYRQAMSRVVSQDITTHYDYSCNQAGSPFVTAPKLRNAHIARYDRRQNPNAPNNHYLTAVYRCNPGYVMFDTRFTELFCSKRSWIGTDPVCVRARV